MKSGWKLLLVVFLSILLLPINTFAEVIENNEEILEEQKEEEKQVPIEEKEETQNKEEKIENLEDVNTDKEDNVIEEIIEEEKKEDLETDNEKIIEEEKDENQDEEQKLEEAQLFGVKEKVSLKAAPNNNVSADSFETLKEVDAAKKIITYTGGDITLEEDYTLKGRLIIESDVVINLNGHTLTLSNVGNNYVITVNKSLTIEGDGEVVINNVYGIQTGSVKGSKITINNGTFNQSDDGYYMFGLSNGEIEINDGTFNAPDCVINNFAGYYREDPDNLYNGKYSDFTGKVTINGGKFNVKNEYGYAFVNSDEMIINNGEVTATGDEAIGIYTTLNGNTTINDGTFNVTGNESVVLYNEGKTSISGGTFNAPNGGCVYDDEETNGKTAITGGTYSDIELDIDGDVAEGYVKYVIDENTVGVGQTTKELSIVEEKDEITIPEEEKKAIEEKVSNKETIGAFYQVNYNEIDPVGNVVKEITETEQKLKLTFDVSNFEKKDNVISRTYNVYRYHNSEVDSLEVTDNKDGTISAESDKFSTYAVTYSDEIIENPETFDNIGQTIITLVLSISCFGITLVVKKYY